MPGFLPAKVLGSRTPLWRFPFHDLPECARPRGQQRSKQARLWDISARLGFRTFLRPRTGTLRFRVWGRKARTKSGAFSPGAEGQGEKNRDASKVQGAKK